MTAIEKVLRVHSGEEFEADDFPTLEDGKRAMTEYEALLDVVDVLEAARPFLGLEIANSVGAQASRALARLDAARSGT
jgi:hypothetical protein